MLVGGESADKAEDGDVVDFVPGLCVVVVEGRRMAVVEGRRVAVVEGRWMVSTLR